MIFPDWITNNFFTVGMLVGQEGTFKFINQITTEYEFNFKPLDFYGCISIIKEFIKIKSITFNTNEASARSKIVAFLTCRLTGVKPIYNALSGENEIPNACKNGRTF